MGCGDFKDGIVDDISGLMYLRRSSHPLGHNLIDRDSSGSKAKPHRSLVRYAFTFSDNNLGMSDVSGIRKSNSSSVTWQSTV